MRLRHRPNPFALCGPERTATGGRSPPATRPNPGGTLRHVAYGAACPSQRPKEEATAAAAPRPSSRRRFWLNSLFVDHSAFRLGWRNWAAVEGGRLYRSNHPLPWQLRHAARRFGLRTVINLRGERADCGSDRLGRAEAATLGLVACGRALREPRRAAPRPHPAPCGDLPPTMAEPALIHCKSGADRTGLAAGIWLLLRGHPPEAALAQLSLRFGHVRRAAPASSTPSSALCGGRREARPKPFLDWVRDDYDEAGAARIFQHGPGPTSLVDRVLRRDDLSGKTRCAISDFVVGPDPRTRGRGVRRCRAWPSRSSARASRPCSARSSGSACSASSPAPTRSRAALVVGAFLAGPRPRLASSARSWRTGSRRPGAARLRAVRGRGRRLRPAVQALPLRLARRPSWPAWWTTRAGHLRALLRRAGAADDADGRLAAAAGARRGDQRSTRWRSASAGSTG